MKLITLIILLCISASVVAAIIGAVLYYQEQQKKENYTTLEKNKNLGEISGFQRFLVHPVSAIPYIKQ